MPNTQKNTGKKETHTIENIMQNTKLNTDKHNQDIGERSVELINQSTYTTKPFDKVKEHQDICDNIHSVYVKKNNDYGDSFHKTYTEYGPIATAIRLDDKLNRYKQLAVKHTSQEVKDESIEDTLLDLANYCILTVLEMRRNKHSNSTINQSDSNITIKNSGDEK